MLILVFTFKPSTIMRYNYKNNFNLQLNNFMAVKSA